MSTIKLMAAYRGVVVFSYDVESEKVDVICERLKESQMVDVIQYTLKTKLAVLEHEGVFGVPCTHDVIRANTISHVRWSYNDWVTRSSVDLEKIAGVYQTDEELIRRETKEIQRMDAHSVDVSLTTKQQN